VDKNAGDMTSHQLWRIQRLPEGVNCHTAVIHIGTNNFHNHYYEVPPPPNALDRQLSRHLACCLLGPPLLISIPSHLISSISLGVPCLLSRPICLIFCHAYPTRSTSPGFPCKAYHGRTLTSTFLLSRLPVKRSSQAVSIMSLE
jgi:hypothetical protein